MARVRLDTGPEALSPAQQISQILSKNAIRVMDLFRQWDADESGSVGKAEFRKAMGVLGFDVPRAEIDGLFDAWDTSGDGAIDFRELNKHLRRRDVHIDAHDESPRHEQRGTRARGSIPPPGSVPQSPFELVPIAPANTTASMARARHQFDTHKGEASKLVRPPVTNGPLANGPPPPTPAMLQLERGETPKPVMLCPRPAAAMRGPVGSAAPSPRGGRSAARPGSAPPSAGRRHAAPSTPRHAAPMPPSPRDRALAAGCCYYYAAQGPQQPLPQWRPCCCSSPRSAASGAASPRAFADAAELQLAKAVLTSPRRPTPRPAQNKPSPRRRGGGGGGGLLRSRDIDGSRRQPPRTQRAPTLTVGPGDVMAWF